MSRAGSGRQEQRRATLPPAWCSGDPPGHKGCRLHLNSSRPGCQKPLVFGPRASDAGKCPHPGNLQRSAAATRSGRQNGGGGGGLVLRGEPGPGDPRNGSRRSAAAPWRLCSPCPTQAAGGLRDRPWSPWRQPSGPWLLSRSPAVPCRIIYIRNFNVPEDFIKELFPLSSRESFKSID